MSAGGPRQGPPATASGAVTGGPEGNERLTASTGTVLLVLFAVQGVTVLFLDQLLTVHFFVGLLLTGPVCLKIGATGYRVVRYYTGAPAYRRKSPPAPVLRVLGPLVVATSAAVLATGVTLAILGPAGTARSPVLWLHKAGFVCWIAVTTVHVLAHVWRLPRLVGAELRRRPEGRGQAVPGRAGRWAVLVMALGAGTAVALAGVHLVSAWNG
ncbi:hypothetical protein [Streptomyces sp. CRN 30]|uniref:hypothetical protein n=1 Tax=Streptomyces sp. CRN 30 TaxID=3075613 RepID=UPI002A8088A7|nr:hypothetical protein [Streptomyces sp. CRN 30]